MEIVHIAEQSLLKTDGQGSNTEAAGDGKRCSKEAGDVISVSEKGLLRQRRITERDKQNIILNHMMVDCSRKQPGPLLFNLPLNGVPLNYSSF